MKHIFEIIKASRLSVAMEEDVQDGKTFKEHEHEFYVEIEDLEQLKGAESVDLQEQWNLKIDKVPGNMSKGALRIRQIYSGDVAAGPNQKPAGEAQYVLTTKVNKGVGKRLEVPVPTTEDAFELFAMLSDSGMIKHRYHFPVDDLVFEVDMYLNPEGGYHPVAKIDLEVKNLSGEIPKLPIKVKSCIMGNTKDADEKKKITQYFDDYFITKNKFLSGSVAQEGFVSAIWDFFTSKKKDDSKATPPVEEPLYRWLAINYQGGKLNSKLRLTGRNFQLNGKMSSMVTLGKTTLTTVEKLLPQVKADLKTYSDIFEKSKGRTKQMSDTLLTLEKQANALLAKKGAQLTREDLDELLLKYQSKALMPFTYEWTPPYHVMLGHYKQGLLDKGYAITPAFIGNQKLEAVPEVRFTAITENELSQLLKLAIELGRVTSDAYSFCEDKLTMGMDLTDPPWRAFAGEFNDMPLAILSHFSHPFFDEAYVDICRGTADRIEFLEELVWNIIRGSVEERDSGDHEYRGDYHGGNIAQESIALVGGVAALIGALFAKDFYDKRKAYNAEKKISVQDRLAKPSSDAKALIDSIKETYANKEWVNDKFAKGEMTDKAAALSKLEEDIWNNLSIGDQINSDFLKNWNNTKDKFDAWVTAYLVEHEKFSGSCISILKDLLKGEPSAEAWNSAMKQMEKLPAPFFAELDKFKALSSCYGRLNVSWDKSNTHEMFKNISISSAPAKKVKAGSLQPLTPEKVVAAGETLIKMIQMLRVGGSAHLRSDDEENGNDLSLIVESSEVDKYYQEAFGEPLENSFISRVIYRIQDGDDALTDVQLAFLRAQKKVMLSIDQWIRASIS